MKIERTGFYRTRNGRKAHVTYVDTLDSSDTEEFPIVGFVFNDTGETSTPVSWTRDGKEFKHRITENDLVAPWEEKEDSKMKYKVGQKFLLKSRRCRIATIVHIHNGYCLISYNEGDVDLFSTDLMDVNFEPYKPPPLKIQGEFWADGLEKCEHKFFEFMANRTEKTRFHGAKKYLFTVEEITE